VDRDDALRRLADARVGRLATTDAGSDPHVVPFVFAVDGETVYWVVDRKPKRSRRLTRLENIRANPSVQVVVDHYEEDWERLWWVRASGKARILGDRDAEEARRALDLLARKYPQYASAPPQGPVVAIDLTGISGWQGGQRS
jgi:PPOX class probable F420-dependent enzyme